jgi:hypothetical protein
MSLTLAERETIVRYAADRSPAIVYTHDQRLMRQMEERGITATEEHVYQGQVVARTYELPRGRLRLRVLGPPTAAQVAAGKRLAESRRQRVDMAATS